MSNSAIRMVLDDLKELYREKALTIAEYKESMRAHHRAEDSMFLLREQGRSTGMLTYEQYQALRMVMDDLKELFRAKELTYEQYRVQLAAAHDRSLADESSDLIAAGAVASGLPWSAVGDSVKGPGGMCEGQGQSSNSSPSANGMSTNGPPRRWEAEEIGLASDRVAAGGAVVVESEQDQGESSQKVQKSGDKSVVKSVVVEESVSAAVVIKSEVSQVKNTKAEEMSEGVVESDVNKESLSKGQSAKKELDWSKVERKGSQPSTGTMQRSTEGGEQDGVQSRPRPRISVPESAYYSKTGTQVPVKKAIGIKQEVPVTQEAPVERVVVEKVGRQVPTKSVKHEVRAEQVVLEKQVVPVRKVSPVKEPCPVKEDEMSTSDYGLRILDDLKELLKCGTITFSQYQAELAAIRKEAREAESSLSPKSSQKRYQGESQSAFTPPLPRPKAQERSMVVDKSGDKSVVKSVVEEEGVSVAVVIKREVCKVKKTKRQSTKKELDWSIAKRKGLKPSTGTMQRSTEGGEKEWVPPCPRPRISVPESAHYSKMGTQAPIKKAMSIKQEVPVKQETHVERVVVEKVGRQVPTKSVKHEVRAKQVVLEKPVVPVRKVSPVKEPCSGKEVPVQMEKVAPIKYLSRWMILWRNLITHRVMSRTGSKPPKQTPQT